MIFKRILSVAALGFVLVACNDQRVSVTETGLKYQFHDKNDDGRKPKVGDIITMHLILKNSKDSILRDTHKEGRPFQMILQVPAFKGGVEEALAMFAKGDSASFFVNVDSLFTRQGQQLPPGVAKGSDVKFTVKILDVQNEQEFQKGQAAGRDNQLKLDAKIIDDFVAKNNLKTIETKSGLNYVVVTEGTGAQPIAGDMVSVHYSGKTLDGKEFDSSYKNPQTGGKPVDFQIGVGMVIPGWEEGIMNMRKGGKSTFIIPSSLAYGEQGAPGTIAPNSVLTFDVELIDIKKAPKR